MSPATFLNLGSVATYPATFTCASWIMSCSSLSSPHQRQRAPMAGPAALTRRLPTTVTHRSQGGHRAASACGQPRENLTLVDELALAPSFCERIRAPAARVSPARGTAEWPGGKADGAGLRAVRR